jgi:hypothetical protein
MFEGTLSGPALTTVDGIAAQLAPYDPVVTPQSWHRILQGAEELINFLTEPLNDETLHDTIAGTPLLMAIGPRRAWLERSIRDLYDGGIETRMLEVLQLVHAFPTT